jgi:hypothetical protein
VNFASSDDASIYREIVRPFIRKGKQISVELFGTLAGQGARIMMRLQGIAS